MTSHLVLPQLDPEPATMSARVLGALLRDELGFDGVVISDALDMAGATSAGGPPETAVRALAAGCDLLCLGNDITEAELDAVVAAVERAVADGRVPAARVHEAAGRVRTLASRVRNAPMPPADPEVLVEPTELIRAFEVRPSARGWPGLDDAVVVRLDADPNIAVGTVPWGPFAAVAADPTSAPCLTFAARPQVLVTPTTALPALDRNAPVTVIGRDIHRHAFARAAVDRLRYEHPRVLVVDMGWPSDDRRYADVATFGASRLVGAALLAFLHSPA